MDRINKLIRTNLKFNFTVETLTAVITLLIMWAGYYVDNHGIFENSIIWLAFWGVGIIVIMNVFIPAWWIVIKKREGFAGMGVTAKNIGPAFILGIVLGCWRSFELLPYLNGDGVIRVILFNLLSIWEVCFVFSWLFTRYTKAFGKIGAVILTAVSVGMYHLGTYPTASLLYLMLCVFICGICFAITDNIFTIWPIYWTIGCSASVIRGYGSNIFGWDMVISIGVLLVFQIICLFIIRLWHNKSKASKMPKIKSSVSNS